MRIGILGCGIAGMSAALFLQRGGFRPEIFETMDSVSDFSPRGELLLPVYTKPISDIPRHARNTFNLDIICQAPIRRIIWHASNAHAQAVGKLGHITLRGQSSNSLDRQIQKHLDCKIHFGVTESVHSLKPRYDCVIDASGQSAPGVKKRRAFLFKGGTIRGRFQPETVHMWHTAAATPGGFAYLIPISARKASVFIVLPLAPEVSGRKYWLRFWKLLVRDLGYEPDFVDSQEFRKYHAQALPSFQPGVLPVGSSLGTATPFLGMDQFKAISTSFYAAKAVSGQPGYWQEMKVLNGHLKRMQVIGKAMDTWGDLAYDSLVRAMAVGATPFFACRLNLLAATSFLLKPYVAIAQRVL